MWQNENFLKMLYITRYLNYMVVWYLAVNFWHLYTYIFFLILVCTINKSILLFLINFVILSQCAFGSVSLSDHAYMIKEVSLVKTFTLFFKDFQRKCFFFIFKNLYSQQNLYEMQNKKKIVKISFFSCKSNQHSKLYF